MNNEKMNQIIDEAYENYLKGDLVELKYDIEKNEDHGEYGYSIDKGEIGEIRYVVPSTENERDENKVYMVKFSDKDGKQRFTQLTNRSFFKVGGGLKIEERELDMMERWLMAGLTPNMTEFDYCNKLCDEHNIPTKLITVTYNGTKIERYE